MTTLNYAICVGDMIIKVYFVFEREIPGAVRTLFQIVLPMRTVLGNRLYQISYDYKNSENHLSLED